MSFKQLGLRAELLHAVEALGYTRPTPIQTKAIPEILKGRDVLAGAQTGTGKTGAFTLPILHQLSQNKTATKQPKALIITPTRELAIQIGENIRLYGKKLSLTSSVIYGGVGIKPQINQLRKGVDILVATPGRLLDHSGRGTLDLSQISCLVLDEADRMLDMGFIKDLRKILKLLPKKRQNMLFSATYSKSIRLLADSLLDNPKIIEVAKKNSPAESVSQKLHSVERGQKRDVLTHLIQTSNWQQVLVFTRTKRGANKLTKQLNADGVKSTAIHGDKSQNNRTKALSEFKNGTVRTLVATDVAARGIDIEQLPCVVNFDLPQVPEDYVHRIGRTGRAGSEGVALSLVYPDEKKLLLGIEKLLKKKIPSESVKGFVSGRARKPVVKTKQPDRPKSIQVKKQRKASIPGEWFAQL